MEQKSNIRNLDFLVIGAPKAGTTSLFHYLRHHPRIYMPPEKEAPFFSRDERYVAGWKDFWDEFFANAPLDSILGKVTPQYMERPSSHIPERIFHLMPKIKLIALLRNPIDRAFSHYRMEVRFSRENRSFKEAVCSYLKDGKAKIYFSASQYGEILFQFRKYFPREQILVHFSEELESMPEVVMDSVLSYLGLQAGFRPLNLAKRYHVGGRQRFPVLTPFVKKIYPLKWLYRTLPISKRRIFWDWFTKEGNVVREIASKVDPAVRHELVNFYLPDIVRLEDLLQKEVPWKEFHG